MKISDLAKKPQLTKVILDDEDTMREFGEAIEFWTWDRQPLDVFMKLANIDQNNAMTVITAVREMILDEEGRSVLRDDAVLPTAVMMRVLTRIVEMLGKS